MSNKIISILLLLSKDKRLRYKCVLSMLFNDKKKSSVILTRKFDAYSFVIFGRNNLIQYNKLFQIIT